jgi:hypothetical protein
MSVKNDKKKKVILKICGWQGGWLTGHCGVGSGSGCVVVVSFDRRDQRGSNDARYVVCGSGWVAVAGWQ